MADLERAIAGSGEEVLTTPGRDGWSVKDHLAHIEGWERYPLALLERRPPAAAIGIDLATFRASDDGALNELVREPTKEQPLSRVLAEARRAHERLLAVIAALPEDDLELLAASTNQKNWPTTPTQSPAGSATSATSICASTSSGSSD